MAADAPFLGSKISLISKSEIRYEGILYTIDPDQSIIALAKVQSFGTEDRPTEMPVPARNEVYEYIIFRGTDIKKIEVCGTPKLHDDPAIVQHSAPTVAQPVQPGNYNRPLGQIGGLGGLTYSYGGNTIPSQASLSSSGGFSLSTTTQPSELPPAAVGEIGAGRLEKPEPQQQSIPAPIGPPSQGGQEVLVGSRSSTPSARKSPVSDAGVQVSPPSADHKPNRNSGGGQTNNRNQRDYQSQPRRNPGNNFFYQGQRSQNYHQGFYQNHPNQYYSGGRGRGGPRRGPPRGRGGGFNQGQRVRQDQQIFEKEFDFETANEEFEELRSKLSKTKISDEGEKEKKEDSGHETATTGDESEESGPTCYDKTKSFFDSISCEAIERSKGRSQRPDWRQERKINVQTFGVATSRRGYFPRGRGGYYSQGGYRRGGYNQGGYYRGSNNGYGGRGNYGHHHNNHHHPQQQRNHQEVDSRQAHHEAAESKA